MKFLMMLFASALCAVGQMIPCKRILICCFLGAVASAGWPMGAQATTYYIDYVAGLDTNSGTNISAAWQHCPGDANATGLANSAAFKPGDTVLFNAASQYFSGNGINLNWSGTSSSPITYSSYGTGRAAIDGENQTNTLPIGFSGQNISNLVFNNLEIRNLQVHNPATVTCDNPYPYPNPSGFYCLNLQQVVIKNCFLHDIGDWTNAPNYSVNWMYGYGINFQGNVGNLTVTNCEFTHIAKAGIGLVAGYTTSGAVTNIVINKCLMHDFVVWGVYVTTENPNSTIQDVVIDSLVWSNYWQYSPNEWTGCSNYFPHADGVIMFLSGNPLAANCLLGTPAHPFVVRNCTFINNATNENDLAGTADIFPCPWGGTVLVYNNTAVNVLNAGEGFFFAYGDIPSGNGSTAPDYRIYNNTCLDTNHFMVIVQNMTNTASRITVNNNLFYSYTHNSGGIPVSIDSLSVTSGTIVLDYDLYMDLTNDNGIANVGGTYMQLPALQAAGYEAHGIYADPMLVTPTGKIVFFTSSSQNNVNLTAASPAIRAGVNLSAYFSTDKAGYPRPATGAWDIGAYQYQGALPPIPITGVLPGTPGAININLVPPGTAGTIQITGIP